ncbi:MAG: sulfite exporter TauE/SafE family protein [Silicimonas sp.]
MPEHFIWLLVAALVVGLAKGGLSSAGSLAVPFLALFMNPVAAAALLLPVFLITDWFAVWLYRRDYSGRNIAILLPAILAGIAIATVIVPYTPEALLLAATGGVGLWYCLRSWIGNSAAAPPRHADIGRGVFWGIITGITTFITHSGAPPSQAYLLPQKLPRMVFAGTMAITFAISNAAKIPGYYALGYFEDMHWSLIATLSAVGIAGTGLGRQIVMRLTDRTYVQVIQALLFILSIVLFWKAFTLITAA